MLKLLANDQIDPTGKVSAARRVLVLRVDGMRFPGVADLCVKLRERYEAGDQVAGSLLDSVLRAARGFPKIGAPGELQAAYVQKFKEVCEFLSAVGAELSKGGFGFQDVQEEVSETSSLGIYSSMLPSAPPGFDEAFISAVRQGRRTDGPLAVRMTAELTHATPEAVRNAVKRAGIGLKSLDF